MTALILLFYSPRENTKAYYLPDDIDQETKTRRLDEIITLQRKISVEINKELVGKTKKVLIESLSRKSDDFYMAELIAINQLSFGRTRTCKFCR
ncbi:MAG: hypothetical protein R3A12_17790 [Ignavibacteria bacterium]